MQRRPAWPYSIKNNMLHLLLPEQKKNLKKEYAVRAASVFMLLLVAVLVLWIATLVPSFALVQIEKKVLEPQQQALLLPLFENGASVKDYVASVNQKIALLAKPEFVVSEYVREIVSRQVRSVEINVIEFMTADVTSASVRLVGIANNRESLVEFSNELEKSEMFSSVDVPFSSFAENADIPFTITLTIQRDA